jgi:hypothetical protein
VEHERAKDIRTTRAQVPQELEQVTQERAAAGGSRTPDGDFAPFELGEE